MHQAPKSCIQAYQDNHSYKRSISAASLPRIRHQKSLPRQDKLGAASRRLTGTRSDRAMGPQTQSHGKSHHRERYQAQDTPFLHLDAVDGGSLTLSGDSNFSRADGIADHKQINALRLKLDHAMDETEVEKDSSQRLRLHVSSSPSGKDPSPKHARQDSSSEDGGERAKRRRRYWRATRQTPERPDPVVAAKNKANRERQRREKLNDCFVDLSMALNPESSLRAEKTTVIADTIKVLGQIRSENGQLQDEKRQLQDRIADVEREKKELLFEYSLLKRELAIRQQGAASLLQPHMPLPIAGQARGDKAGLEVVMGVPVGSSVMPQSSGSQYLDKTLYAKQVTASSMNAESQALTMNAPMGFLDMDLSILETFGDMGKGDSVDNLISTSPIPWLSTGDSLMPHNFS